jgi:hypothetical protein
MTSGAIIAYRLLVNIGMAGNTVFFDPIKFQRGVARSAFQIPVLTGQSKSCAVM